MGNKILRRLSCGCLTFILAWILAVPALAEPAQGICDIRLTLDFCTDSEIQHPRDDYLANVFLLQDTSTGRYVQAALDAGTYRVAGESSAEVEATRFCFGQDAADPAALTIAGLPQGGYKLIHLETAQGYQLLYQDVTLEIAETSAVVNGESVALEDENTLFLYLGIAPCYQLPEMHHQYPNWLRPVYLALIVTLGLALCVCIGLFFRQKRKENNTPK